MSRLVWYVAAGSAVGGVCRFLLSTFIQQRSGGSFPLGTLLINITGSFVLGFLVRYALATPAITPELRALLMTGFCGGYTTFSTFSFETATLIEEAQYQRAGLYMSLSVGIALLGMFAGFVVAREFIEFRGRI
ncbi:MAG: fluoride efflux transporter CrcB [Gemmatimonadaceae bacterium]